jgi:GT2 family glycosyltransferase
MLIRRRLFEQIGPFADGLVCEDYDFWLRAASAGAVFFYDPTIIVRYRRHGGNVSNDLLSMARAVRAVHLRHAGWVGDNGLTTTVVAHDFANVGRLLVDQDARTARREYVGALRHRLALRPLTWAAILSLPDRCQSAPITILSTTRDLLRRLQVPGSPGR